ncbi:class I SAM-dependent methyltransferase [Heyndrickxia sporothermodurans]|nr:class I SAM-dependent methyltransferase [Heyndrickxia sporothermodurans]
MSEWRELLQDSQARWETNADYWDDYMGEESNQFHRELIRPYTEKLLNIEEGQSILDIACGNGNFSRRLAELGANVVAFDYSTRMIERAKSRSESFLDQIEYQVKDATKYESILELGEQRFDGAVANMSLMDIADITPLIKALNQLLKKNGVFVFSITHPCFQNPGVRTINETEDFDGEIINRNSIQISNYLTPNSYKAIGIKGQPTPHFMFHRPLSYYLNSFFAEGFMLDGIEEPSFKKVKDNHKFDWYEIPAVVILRFKKL